MIKQELEEAKLKGGAGRLFPEALLETGLRHLQQTLIKVPLHPREKVQKEVLLPGSKANNGVP